MSFKLQIVHEIEQGLTTISRVKKEYAIQTRSTIVQWLIKFGDFD
jgi:transposase-like protein